MMLREKLQQTTIKAPRAGCIGEWQQDDGALVEQGEALLIFWEVGEPMLTVELRASAAGTLRQVVALGAIVNAGVALAYIETPLPPETPTPPARATAAPARRSTMGEVEELAMVEQAKISDLPPQGGERPHALPAPDARPRPRQRPKIISRTTYPTGEQAKEFDGDVQELAARGYTIPRAVFERAMYAAWLALPLADKVRLAYEQEADEVKRGYGQGIYPR